MEINIHKNIGIEIDMQVSMILTKQPFRELWQGDKMIWAEYKKT